MISRVATFATSNQMIDAALQAQSTMANAQLQEASGLVSSDYGGLGDKAGQVVNLEISLTRSQSYADAATSADNKIEVAYSTVTSISDLLSNFRTALTSAESVNSDTTTVVQSAQQMLQEMSSLLNTQYGSSYLFSGAKTSTAPVDISSASYSAPTSLSSSDTSYYQGDDQAQSVRVSDNETVSWGVTADNSAFEEGLRALSYVANSSSLSSSDIEQALDLTVNAIDGVTAIQAKLGVASSAVQTASSNQTDFQTFTKTLTSDLTSVDIPQITAQMTTYQTQLEAAYAAIAKVQGLSLASYLR